MVNFLGSYTYAVDAKGRVNVPKKFRKYIRTDADVEQTGEEDTLVIARGFEGCLSVYPIDEWEQMLARIRELPSTKKNTRIYTRILASEAVAGSMDKQGRIALPRQLKELAGIDKQVLIVGTLDHFELWNPEKYNEEMDKSEHTYESIAESLFD